jgi:peptide/nickel transport system permease protein
MSGWRRSHTYIAKRLLLAVPTLFLVAVFVFGMMRLIPGDPAQVMLGDVADPTALAAMRHQMGLDQPLPVQFAKWLSGAALGNLGRSTLTGEPVAPLILERFQVTASIVLAAIVIATLVAVAAGLLAAWYQNRAVDVVIVGLATLGLAMPSFWLGLLLLLIFGVDLQWLPVVGYVSPGEDLATGLRYLILPVVTLVLAEVGVLTRTVRAGALEVLAMEYVAHARAKGASEPRVLLRHVLPNAFAPTLTMVGLVLGHLLGGAAVIETVFTLPGLGRLIVDSILTRDYPVVQGCLLFTAAIYVAVNLIVDLCYPLFDPRVAVAA